MTPWDVIEGALARKKPIRGPQWLADQLKMTIQAVMNWKTRRVPPGKFPEIADLLGLEVDHLYGRKPVPWEVDASWPFPDISRDRFNELTEMQRGAIQQIVSDAIRDFESQSGKLPNSGPRTGTKN